MKHKNLSLLLIFTLALLTACGGSTSGIESASEEGTITGDPSDPTLDPHIFPSASDEIPNDGSVAFMLMGNICGQIVSCRPDDVTMAACMTQVWDVNLAPTVGLPSAAYPNLTAIMDAEMARRIQPNHIRLKCLNSARRIACDDINAMVDTTGAEPVVDIASALRDLDPDCVFLFSDNNGVIQSVDSETPIDTTTNGTDITDTNSGGLFPSASL